MKDIENIYNTYLRISRGKRNLPYKIRKDFSDIADDEKYPTLLKLESFFKRNSYVNLNNFFEAPYELYTDEKYFDLDFYLTQKAIKIYNLYQKKKTYIDPDSDIQINSIKDGLLFIYGFCKNGKSLDSSIFRKGGPGVQVSPITSAGTFPPTVRKSLSSPPRKPSSSWWRNREYTFGHP